MSMAAKGGVGKLAGAKEVYSLIRGMSINEIEESVKEPPQILVVSRDPNVEDLVAVVTGVRGTPSLTYTTPDKLPKSLDRYTLIVVHNPNDNADFLAVREAAGLSSYRVFDIGPAEDPRAIPSLQQRITEGMPEDAVALGRWYPALRPAAAKAIINDTSRVNAQFALVAAAPTMLPVLGELAAVGADLIVLTRNQLYMAIKLAAVYGKPLNNRWDILKDLLPVIGGGFMWRTIAREAAAILPFAAGTVPKVAIAYAGTAATGRAIEAYYRYGVQTTREQLTGYFKNALNTAKAKFGSEQAIPASTSAAPPG
jgi:uncharacterized protein (DUF697 family)